MFPVRIDRRYAGIGAAAIWLAVMEAVAIMAYHVAMEKMPGTQTGIGWMLAIAFIIALFSCLFVLTDDWTKISKEPPQKDRAIAAIVAFGAIGAFLGILADYFASRITRAPNMEAFAFIMLAVMATLSTSAASRVGKVTETLYHKKPVGSFWRWSFFAACTAVVALYPQLDWLWLSGLVGFQLLCMWLFFFRTTATWPKKKKKKAKKKT